MNRFMPEISLKNGLVAVVDDCDYDRIARYDWSPKKGRRGAWYVQRMIHAGDQVICREMQRDIMDPFMTVPGRSLFVDHKNHDPLDNRRDNLRWMTPLESVLHRRRFLSNTLGYHGIQITPDGKYRAHLQMRGARYTDDGHLTAEDAARAYNRLALEHHGDLALLNDIPNDKATFSPKARRVAELQCKVCSYSVSVVLLNQKAYFGIYDGAKLEILHTTDMHIERGYREIVRMHRVFCAAEFDLTKIIPGNLS
jgi:HNH endonuclease